MSIDIKKKLSVSCVADVLRLSNKSPTSRSRSGLEETCQPLAAMAAGLFQTCPTRMGWISLRAARLRATPEEIINQERQISNVYCAIAV